MIKKLTKVVSTFIILTACLFIMTNTYAQEQTPPPPPPQGGGGGGAGPDFTHAAEALGVTATELSAAIGGPPPNFVAAAEKLGVELNDLVALLPAPPAGDIPEGLTAEDFLQPE